MRSGASITTTLPFWDIEPERTGIFTDTPVFVIFIFFFESEKDLFRDKYRAVKTERERDTVRRADIELLRPFAVGDK